MKKFSLLILVSAFAFAGSAQNFLLYSFKGNVSVVENNVESKAKVGKTLDNAATVKIPAGSAATLICNEAAMFTISKAGNYSLRTFGDSCKVSSNSVSANYVKYVWAQMTKSSGSAGSNRKAYMSNVGAVSRGNPMNSVWIDPLLDTVNYSGEKTDFPLSWKSYTMAKEFEFLIFKEDNLVEPFYRATVNKLKIPVSQFIGKLKPGTKYYWTAIIKDEMPTDLDLKVFTYVSKDTYSSLLDKVKSQGASVETPVEQIYRTGFMLEDAHFLAEAYQYYTKAALTDSMNMLYRSTLMSFKKDYEIK